MDPMGMKRQGSQESDGRRAAHVKWDGKTIALGTFSALDAVDKCERAKALTKKWRATMVPKPDVEWVKKALERLNIRVVNDRPGRRRKDEILEKDKTKNTNTMRNSNLMGGEDQMFLPSSMGRANQGDNPMLFSPQQGFTGMPSTNNNSMSSFGMGAMGAMAGNNNARMSTGSMHNNPINRRFSNESGSGLGSYNAMPMGNANFDNNMAMNSLQQGRLNRELQMSSKFPGMDSPAGSRQHFTVLKEHHDNLIKELQQTTYMMQMYQRNYDQSEQQAAVNNIMSNSVYGSGSTTGGISQLRDNFTLRQDQSRQNQGYSNPLHYQYDIPDRRNSLGMTEAQFSQRQSMQNSYLASSSGNSGLQQIMNQNPNMVNSGSDRAPFAGYSSSNISPRSNMRRFSNSNSNEPKRQKTEERTRRDSGGGASESNSGYSSKQEEV